MSETMNAMRRRTLCAILFALCSCAAAGQSQRGAQRKLSKEEAAVLAADRAWADAIARGDVAALDRVFADEFAIVSPNGDVKDKRQEIDNLAPAPDVTTYYFRTEDTEVHVYKDAAVVRGRAVWKVKYKGQDIDNNRRYTSTYVRRGGHWLLVAQQISGNIPSK